VKHFCVDVDVLEMDKIKIIPNNICGLFGTCVELDLQNGKIENQVSNHYYMPIKNY
jgi:hypothetical protein